MRIIPLVVMCMAWVLGSSTIPSAEARVVINEISYHPPEDLDSLQFIELYNSGAEAVEVGGWKINAVEAVLAEKTRIGPSEFLVLARDAAEFQKVYGFAAAAEFKKSLKKGGEKLELLDANGRMVDKVKFKDSSPWPLSADGQTATLERISPDADSNAAENWASSPLSEDATKPGGTPGKRNANYSSALPPVITKVAFEPKRPKPGEAVTVSAEVRDRAEGVAAKLIYRVAGAGFEKPEMSLDMEAGSDRRFVARIPAQAENQIVRFRIEAVNRSGTRRLEPPAFEPQPAYSYFVHDKFETGKIPWGFLIHVDEADFKKAQDEKPNRNPPGMGEGDRDRFMAKMAFGAATDLAPIWTELCLTQNLSFEQISKSAAAIRARIEERQKMDEKIDKEANPKELMKEAPKWVRSFHENTRAVLDPILNEAQREALNRWQQSKTNATPPPGRPDPETVLQRYCDIEAGFLDLTTRANIEEIEFSKIKAACADAIAERKKLVPALKAAMQGENQSDDLEMKVQNLRKDTDGKFAAAVLDEAVRRDFFAAREKSNPFARNGGNSQPNQPEPPRGHNAFVFVPADTGEPELFDFVKLAGRGGGYKVHFGKHHPLQGMTVINLLFDYNDRFALAEPLAYEVYRRAGMPAEKTDFVRLFVDGRPFGYHLLIEQPNRAFLKRNNLRDDGNLYKVLWYERGLIRQHEKKTNPRSGHEDLVELVESLEKTKGAEQWKIIEKNFNVDEMVTYYAVNTLLTHWDGFFNNYFLYHDLHGTGKWEMYPWDQDKTWGFHDSLPDGEIFYDMPLTYGMEGDRPPGQSKDSPPPKGFNGGSWWRPGGYLSKPLLANTQFRKLFLARTRELAENVYTEKTFFPIIDRLRDQLGAEVRVRAEAVKEDPAEAQAKFERNLKTFKDHLVKRRKFLLEQDEIKNLEL